MILFYIILIFEEDKKKKKIMEMFNRNVILEIDVLY